MKHCYLLLMQIEHMSFEDKRDDVEQSEEIIQLNDAIYKTYYKNIYNDNFEIGERSSRACLSEWKSSENAYSNLKQFSNKYEKDEYLEYDEIVSIFRRVISILQENSSPFEVEDKVKKLLNIEGKKTV